MSLRVGRRDRRDILPCSVRLLLVRNVLYPRTPSFPLRAIILALIVFLLESIFLSLILRRVRLIVAPRKALSLIPQHVTSSINNAKYIQSYGSHRMLKTIFVLEPNVQFV